jgi:hypothetical protein
MDRMATQCPAITSQRLQISRLKNNEPQTAILAEREPRVSNGNTRPLVAAL